MRTTNELIEEAVALPVEERARVVDCLLRSLNPTNESVDRAWGAEAARRLAEVVGGEPGAAATDVFARARDLIRR